MANLADLTPLLEVVGINLILSGDNLVVAGLAARNLTGRKRKIVLTVGIAGAVAVQTGATLMAASLLRVAIVSCIAGVVLIWVAIRLLRDTGNGATSRGGGNDNTFRSIVTVAGSYLLMCLDNILAVAAVAQGHPVLLALGLLLSCLVLIPCSVVVAGLMKRFRLLVVAAAAFLGWIAGAMIVTALAHFTRDLQNPVMHTVVPLVMTIVVLSSPWWMPGHLHHVNTQSRPPQRGGGSGHPLNHRLFKRLTSR